MKRAVVLVAFLAFAVHVSQVQTGPSTSDADWKADTINEVSGYRILQTILELQTFETRDFHTDEAAASALLIQQWMEDIGLETQLQEFVADGKTVVNVIGTLNPRSVAPDLNLIGAHYDSRNRYATSIAEAENESAPGADDNASGVAAMLEIAYVLANCDRFEAATRFVAFGAEERGFVNKSGLAGSSAFAQAEASDGIEYGATFVMDMIGFQAGNESRMTLVTNNESISIAQSVTDAVAAYNVDLLVDVVPNESLRYSDHASFWDQGYSSILMIEELDPHTYAPVNPYYHTESDTADKLSSEQMEDISSALIGTILDLTDSGEDSYSFLYSTVLAVAGVSGLVLAVIVVARRKGRGS